MKVESIAECSPWSILQYFWPALSDNWSWKTIFGLFWVWLFYTGFTVCKEGDGLVGMNTLWKAMKNKWKQHDSLQHFIVFICTQ